MTRLFISHAASDEDLVEDLTDLLNTGIGLGPDDIFCSSLPGMSIPTGANFVDYIKSQVSKPEMVLIIISKDFLRSQFCSAEAGVTWALSLPIFPLLVPPVTFADVKGVLAGVQAGMMLLSSSK